MGKYIWCLAFLFFSVALSAQDIVTGELLELHRQYKNVIHNDTAAVNRLVKICYYHQDLSKRRAYASSNDSILFFAKKILSRSQASNYTTGEGIAYLLFAVYEASARNNKQSLEYAEKAIKVFKQINNKPRLAEAYLFITFLDELNPTVTSINAAREAEKIYDELGDVTRQAYLQQQIAYQYMALNEYDKALSFFRQSMATYAKLPAFYPASLYSYSGAGHACNRLGNFSEGFSYYLEGVKLGEEKAPDSKETLHCMNGLGVSYINQSQFDQAYYYLTKAYGIAKQYADVDPLIDLEGNIVQALLGLKRYRETLPYLRSMEQRNGTSKTRITIISRSIDAYVELKEYQKADKYAKEAIDLINKSASGYYSSRLYMPVAKYYYATGQYKLARKYLEEYKPIAQKSSSKIALNHIHRQLFKIDSVEQAFDSAVKNLKLHQTYKDSLYNENSQKRIDELVVKYDVLKKDRDLQLQEKNNKLLVKQNELQQEKLYRSNLSRNVSIAGVGVLVVFLGLLFHRHRTNKRVNALLQLQQAEITNSNDKLLRLVDEKEWLLKEIHHRVKNNLHIVMSLLNSQSYFLKDESALEAIQNSRHRIQSMSLIHQKLYMSDNLAAISMPEYISDLMDYLSDSFAAQKQVKFHLHIEKVVMDVSQAVPIGLILNEAITNCFKYAFPDGSGNISVSLTNTIGDSFRLEIRDDGVGFPEGLDIVNAKSLGMKLINGLTQDLDAVLDITSGREGTQISIEFSFKHLLFDPLHTNH